MARACLGRREEAREGELGGAWPGPVWGGGRGVARACQGRREEAREGESGGAWPGPVWGGGRKPGRVS